MTKKIARYASLFYKISNKKDQLHQLVVTLSVYKYSTTTPDRLQYLTLSLGDGSVLDPDTKLEYTETQMNHIPESQTAEEFKKDDYKFLIVAEKFQTGFDQPLLSAMYVDKKLGGVNAVQTLSRLNRTTYGKEDTFVLDFFNKTDDIKEAFQPYYTTTVLSEATNPNLLHNLEREVRGFKLFTDFELNGFVEELFGGATPDKLNHIIDVIVERALSEKDAEEIESFKSVIYDYLKKYSFISQIVTFEDPQLEKLYIFLKFLIKKLPRRENPLPVEVLEAIDMETYKIDKKGEVNVALENKEGELDPMTGGGGKKTGGDDEEDALSKIIKDINERYGTNFSDNDKVILNDLSARLLKSSVLQGSIQNNSKDSAKLKFDQLFQDELVGMLDNHFNLYQKLDQSPELKKFVQEKVFEHVVKKINNGLVLKK